MDDIVTDLVIQDFITYLPETSNIGVHEGVQGRGTLDGSARLNEYFRELFKNEYKALMPDLIQEVSQIYPGVVEEEDILDIAVSEFEKRKLLVSDDRRMCSEMIINIPGINRRPRHKIEQGFVRISRHEIEELFAKVINPIAESIEQQISSFN